MDARRWIRQKYGEPLRSAIEEVFGDVAEIKGRPSYLEDPHSCCPIGIAYELRGKNGWPLPRGKTKRLRVELTSHVLSVFAWMDVKRPPRKDSICYDARFYRPDDPVSALREARMGLASAISEAVTIFGMMDMPRPGMVLEFIDLSRGGEREEEVAMTWNPGGPGVRLVGFKRDTVRFLAQHPKFTKFVLDYLCPIIYQ